MNIVKPVGKFLKKNGPLLLTIGASAGVVVSNFLTAKAVLKADELLNDIPESELKSLSTKKQIVKIYAAPVATGLATISCVVGAHVMNKSIQAGLTAALGATTNLFNYYRAKTDPETDQAIMTEYAVQQIKPEDIPVNTEETETWTDPFIDSLTDGHITCYKAKKSDILTAFCWMKDLYHQDASVTLRDFYDVLRDLDVDIPIVDGDQDITWGWSDERLDWYGCDPALETSWEVKHNEFGAPINSIYFSITDGEIREEDEKLEWFVNQKDKQDLQDAAINENLA